MTIGDMGHPPEEIANMDRKRQADIQAANQAFLNELSEPEIQIALRDTLTLTGIGPILRMDLPRAWEELPEERHPGQLYTLHECLVRKNHDVKLYLFDRGSAVTPGSLSMLRRILQRAPHTLSDGEYAQLGEIFRSKSTFSNTGAHTDTVDGKRVLILDGQLHQGSATEKGIRTMYIDSGNGHIQEVIYQAPSGSFQRYLRDAENAFTSMRLR